MRNIKQKAVPPLEKLPFYNVGLVALDSLLVADGLYGVHVSGLLGGDVTEEDADEDADEEGDVDAPHGDAGGHAEQGYEELAGADAHEDAQ